MNNKLYLCAIFTATILSSSANADFSDWYKKATSNEDSTQQVPAQQQQAPGQIQQQAPVQVQQQPIQQRQYNSNRNTTATRYQNNNANVTGDSGLEARMNNLNSTIENLNKSSKSGDNLTNNYLNIVQFIVINEETRKLDGKDNTSLINNMLAGIVSCQNKYKVDVIQKVNNQLPRDVANTVQRYLSQNERSIGANGNCLY
ncbi:transporter (plasmid) [Acinetobacter baumannii]|uniref:transporter n=1 Tax=Acinetobacter baumannii TaxID=470 RepID=UPI001DF43BD2|nr:transporter [Acinetobacter baumannii]EKT8002031.1 transporter [Acinetobacter baumannii]EKU1731473.1 transporter [Acinetobacter baumannii]EKV2312352.1 transporter [Acinetobacter baumannii]EKV2432928.1 transporter [Acinetobacter baumannii]EKV2437191.1 transporter [Acinetobacter baumannii]